MCHQSVGLLQGVIETQGIPTVSISVRPEITCGVGVSRAAYLRFPTGTIFGEPFRKEQHRTILHSVLQLLEQLAQPSIVELPFRWRRWDK